MYRSKAILSSLGNAHSKITTLTRAQVGFPSNSYSPFDSFALRSRFFSSKPESMLQLVLENDWSGEVEERLRKPEFPLTHETAVYVLKRLDKHPQKAYSFLHWVFRDSGLTPTSPLYSMKLRILVMQRSMKHFWMTLQDMKQGGFSCVMVFHDMQ